MDWGTLALKVRNKNFSTFNICLRLSMCTDQSFSALSLHWELCRRLSGEVFQAYQQLSDTLEQHLTILVFGGFFLILCQIAGVMDNCDVQIVLYFGAFMFRIHQVLLFPWAPDSFARLNYKYINFHGRKPESMSASKLIHYDGPRTSTGEEWKNGREGNKVWRGSASQRMACHLRWDWTEQR